MKKYILFVSLLAIVFLGWGNVAMGQQGTEIELEGGSNDWYNSSYGDTPTNPYEDAYPVYEMDPNQTTDGTPDTFCNIKGSQYEGDPNAIISVSGIGCVCKDGYKDVKGVCMDCKLPDVCCGVELNTNVPFIGNCIEDKNYGGVTSERAFPVLMGALTQILVTIILIVSFVLIVIGGVMIATGNPSGGKKMIMKVVVGIALLGASGVILRLINPNFFG